MEISLYWQKKFKKLPNKNIVKSMKVAGTWEYFIINEKFYQPKGHYETKQKEKDGYGGTPLHKAALEGNVLECKLIIDNVEDKNPQDDFGRTPSSLCYFLWSTVCF